MEAIAPRTMGGTGRMGMMGCMLNDSLKSRNAWAMGRVTNGTNDNSHAQELSNDSEWLSLPAA